MDEYPEEAIPGTQPGTATGSGQHGQLVPREEILDNPSHDDLGKPCT